MKGIGLLFLALPLAAQLQVDVVSEGTPVPLGATLQLGRVAVRSAADFRFRVTNRGPAGVPIQTIAVGGAGFSLTSPFVPFALSPAQSHDFLVRFAPPAEGSYSAVLAVNSFSSVLRAAGVLAPSLFLSSGSGTAEITSANIELRTAVRTLLTVSFSIRNPHPSPLAIDAFSIRGSGFHAANPPALPFVLQPAESQTVVMTFSATEEGDYEGQLTIGARRVSIMVNVFRPVLAPPAIVLDEALPRNGQQLRVRLRFPEPAAAPASGTLRLTFLGAVEDSAVSFSNGSREMVFDVSAGDREASFGGAPEVALQTGTTAGVLRLEAVTEGGTASESFRLERAPVVVDSATAMRRGSNLELDIVGFDNTRGFGSLNCRFFDRSGTALGPLMTVAVADAFRAFFEKSTLGGVFRLRLVFPVTGDATMVGSVLLEAANAVGRTDIPRLSFP